MENKNNLVGVVVGNNVYVGKCISTAPDIEMEDCAKIDLIAIPTPQGINAVPVVVLMGNAVVRPDDCSMIFTVSKDSLYYSVYYENISGISVAGKNLVEGNGNTN